MFRAGLRTSREGCGPLARTGEAFDMRGFGEFLCMSRAPGLLTTEEAPRGNYQTYTKAPMRGACLKISGPKTTSAPRPVHSWKNGIMTAVTSCGRYRRSSKLRHGDTTPADCRADSWMSSNSLDTFAAVSEPG